MNNKPFYVTGKDRNDWDLDVVIRCATNHSQWLYRRNIGLPPFDLYDIHEISRSEAQKLKKNGAKYINFTDAKNVRNSIIPINL